MSERLEAEPVLEFGGSEASATQPSQPTDEDSSSGEADDRSRWLLSLIDHSLDSIPIHQRLILGLLVKQLANKTRELKCDHQSGNVTLIDIEQAKDDNARISENTMKMSDVSEKEEWYKLKELLVFCDLIKYIKDKRPPVGVVIDCSKMGISRQKLYEKGTEYHENHELGKGVCGVVKDVTDKKSNAEQAEKCVNVQSFQPNEFLALYRLQNVGGRIISPKLHGVKIDKNKIKLYMEKLDGYIPITDVVSQLQDKTCEERFGFALSVLHRMAEAVNFMHNRQLFHMDLHGGNIMLGKGEDDLPEVKLIDFGSTKTRSELSIDTRDPAAAFEAFFNTHEISETETDATQKRAINSDIQKLKIELDTNADRGAKSQAFLSSLSSDMRNILKIFCSLVIGADVFESIFDFGENYTQKISEIIILPTDKKGILLKILDEGFNAGLPDEPQFIKMVKNQFDVCQSGSTGTGTLLDDLDFSPRPPSTVDLDATNNRATPSGEVRERQKDTEMSGRADVLKALGGIQIQQ